MKKAINFIAMIFGLGITSFAQQEKHEKKEEKHEIKESVSVPTLVKSALVKKYPEASKVTWEKEKGNYEANWGGKSGEDNSVQFTPSGNFIEIVKAISISELPKPVSAYVNQHYSGTKITEAGKVTDAEGKLSYEAEVKGKDLIFDENGNFVKAEK